jgi:hypothetical protein
MTVAAADDGVARPVDVRQFISGRGEEKLKEKKKTNENNTNKRIRTKVLCTTIIILYVH